MFKHQRLELHIKQSRVTTTIKRPINMILIGHKDTNSYVVMNCTHLSPKIIGNHIIKVQHLGDMRIGIHMQVCLFIRPDFCMVLGCSIMSIYILDRLYQISMKHLIACHGHIMEIISGCDWLFKRSQNIGCGRNDMYFKFKVVQ
jgi:hypothetical protein